MGFDLDLVRHQVHASVIGLTQGLKPEACVEICFLKLLLFYYFHSFQLII